MTSRIPVKPPVALKRRLGLSLRAMRQDAGLTIDEAATRARITKSSLSRVENGITVPHVNTLRVILNLYGASDATIAELEAVQQEAAKKGWGKAFFGEGVSVPDWLRSYVGLEATAESVCVFHHVVPGLLQTGDYARAVFAAGGHAGESLERRLRLRVVRQDAIRSGVLRVHAVLDESIMHRHVGGPEVTRGQMARLVELGELPNVTIQILPFAHGAASAAIAAPFVVLGLAPDPDIVYLESHQAGHFIEDAPNVEAFTLAFRNLADAALTAPASAQLLAAASKAEG